jgi:hypothetical protein
MLINFEDVKGYKTRENAEKRGREIEEKFLNGNLKVALRWVVLSLPNGRFAPCIIVNQNVNPGWFIGLTNVCCVN